MFDFDFDPHFGGHFSRAAWAAIRQELAQQWNRHTELWRKHNNRFDENHSTPPWEELPSESNI